MGAEVAALRAVHPFEEPGAHVKVDAGSAMSDTSAQTSRHRREDRPDHRPAGGQLYPALKIGHQVAEDRPCESSEDWLYPRRLVPSWSAQWRSASKG